MAEFSRRNTLLLGALGATAVAFGAGIKYFTEGKEPDMGSEIPKPSMGHLNCSAVEYAEGFIPLNPQGSLIIENEFNTISPSIREIVARMKDSSLATIFTEEEKGDIVQMRSNSGPVKKREVFRIMLDQGFSVQTMIFQLRPAIGEPGAICLAQGQLGSKKITTVLDFNPNDLPRMDTQESTSGAFRQEDKINALLTQVKNGALNSNILPSAVIVSRDHAERVAIETREGKYLEQILTALPTDNIRALAVTTENGGFKGTETQLSTGTEVGVKRVFIDSVGGVWAVVMTRDANPKIYAVSFEDLQTILEPNLMNENDLVELRLKRQASATQIASGEIDKYVKIAPTQRGWFGDLYYTPEATATVNIPVYRTEMPFSTDITKRSDYDPSSIWKSLTCVAVPLTIAATWAGLRLHAAEAQAKKEAREQAQE